MDKMSNEKPGNQHLIFHHHMFISTGYSKAQSANLQSPLPPASLHISTFISFL